MRYRFHPSVTVLRSAVLAALILALPASAWTSRGHKFHNRVAVGALPAADRAYLPEEDWAAFADPYSVYPDKHKYLAETDLFDYFLEGEKVLTGGGFTTHSDYAIRYFFERAVNDFRAGGRRKGAMWLGSICHLVGDWSAYGVHTPLFTSLFELYHGDRFYPVSVVALKTEKGYPLDDMMTFHDLVDQWQAVPRLHAQLIKGYEPQVLAKNLRDAAVLAMVRVIGLRERAIATERDALEEFLATGRADRTTIESAARGTCVMLDILHTAIALGQMTPDQETSSSVTSVGTLVDGVQEPLSACVVYGDRIPKNPSGCPRGECGAPAPVANPTARGSAPVARRAAGMPAVAVLMPRTVDQNEEYFRLVHFYSGIICEQLRRSGINYAAVTIEDLVDPLRFNADRYPVTVIFGRGEFWRSFKSRDDCLRAWDDYLKAGGTILWVGGIPFQSGFNYDYDRLASWHYGGDDDWARGRVGALSSLFRQYSPEGPLEQMRLSSTDEARKLLPKLPTELSFAHEFRKGIIGGGMNGMPAALVEDAAAKLRSPDRLVPLMTLEGPDAGSSAVAGAVIELRDPPYRGALAYLPWYLITPYVFDPSDVVTDEKLRNLGMDAQAGEWFSGVVRMLREHSEAARRKPSPDFPVAEDGQARCAIVLGEGATGTEEFAAAELQRYLEAITGANIDTRRRASKWRAPARTSGAAPARERHTWGSSIDIFHGSAGIPSDIGQIVLGRAETNGKIAELLRRGALRSGRQDLGTDGFLIETASLPPGEAPILVVMGARDRGTLYGVYDLLEDQCGVGFFWDAEQIPSRPSLTVPPLHVVERPFFAERMYVAGKGPAESYSFGAKWSAADWEREMDWACKRRVNQIATIFVPPEVERRVNERMGVPAHPLTEGDRMLGERYRRVVEGVRLRDMEPLVYIPYTLVTQEFKQAHPEGRYFQAGWLDLGPTEEHIYPADPLYAQWTAAYVEELNKFYGAPSHQYYGANPYPEANFHTTPEETREIVTSFPIGVMNGIAAADPEGIWYYGSWPFVFDPNLWDRSAIQDFYDNCPNDRVVVWDLDCTKRPIYSTERGDYFFGHKWSFGVLHAFGNGDAMFGNMADLLDRLDNLVSDPKAVNCIGLNVQSEVLHYNPAFYDLLWRVAWNPKWASLSAFTRDYCRRRYGEEGADAMATAWDKVIDAVYRTNNGEWVHEGRYQKRLNPGGNWRGGPSPEEMLEGARLLKSAIDGALACAPTLGEEMTYQNDLVDLARQYISHVFNLRLQLLDRAVAAKDAEGFERHAAAMDALLENLETVLSSRPQYRVEDTVDWLYANDREVGLDVTREAIGQYVRDEGLTFALMYPRIVDYQSKDMYELARFYDRPRVDAYIEFLRDHLASGEPIDDRTSLDQKYRAIEVRWGETGYDPALAPPYAGTELEAVQEAWKAVGPEESLSEIQQDLASEG